MKKLAMIGLMLQSVFAYTAYENAILAEEKGEYDKALEYLFKALERPGDQELEIRLLLADYLEALGDKKLIDQNNRVLYGLMEAEENRKKAEKKQGQTQEMSNDFFSQSLELTNQFEIQPWGEDSLGMEGKTWTPELEYTFEWIHMGSKINQMLSFGLGLSKDTWDGDYAYNSAEGYVYETNWVQNLDAYSVSPSLSYTVFQNWWNAGITLDGYHSESYNWNTGLSGFVSAYAYKGEKNRISVTAFGSYQQLFANYYAAIVNFQNYSFDKKLRIGLSYSFDVVVDTLKTSEEEINYFGYDASGLAFDEVENLTTAKINQTELLHNLQFSLQYKPSKNWKLNGAVKYSKGKKLREDQWLEMNGNLQEVDLSNSAALANFFYGTQVYYLGDAYLNADGSLNYAAILNEYKLNPNIEKWRFDLSGQWSPLEGQWLKLRYLTNVEKSDVDVKDWVNHPDYSGNTRFKQSFELGYGIEF